MQQQNNSHDNNTNKFILMMVMTIIIITIIIVVAIIIIIMMVIKIAEQCVCKKSIRMFGFIKQSKIYHSRYVNKQQNVLLNGELYQ